MPSRKSKDKDRSDRKSRGDSTKNLVEVAPSAIVDQPSSLRGIDGAQTTRQPTLRRAESDDYYNPRPDPLPSPGYVESATYYPGPPPNQPSYNGVAAPGQAYEVVGGGSGGYTTLLGPSQHQNSEHNGGGHGGYTGGGPIYQAGYGDVAPAHYRQHAGAVRPPMPQQGASAEYYHGSGSYSQPPKQPHQHAQSYNVGGVGGQGQMPGAFPPTLQHTQSTPQTGYGSYTHPVPTQGQKPPRRDSSSSSSSSSYVDISRTYTLPPVRRTPLGAIRTFFTAPSESRRRVIRRKSSRTLREQRRQGRLAQGRTRSASSSEADSDLAYGSGYLRRRKRRGSRGSRSPGGRRYAGSRSPRRYGENGRRVSVARDNVDGRRENFQPAAAGGVPLPGLSVANTMPGGFPIETSAIAGAAGAIAAGLSRKDSRKSKKDVEKEILKLGEDLHNLAKRQNKYDLEEAAKRGRFNVVRHNEGRHGLGPKGFGSGGSPVRGIPSSKPARKEKEDDGWETSDSDDTSSSSESADSAMAFGGENTYQSWKWREPSHPPRRSQSHQSQNQTRDQNNQHYPHPPTRKSTIVDPKLFGPQNSLLGVVERPVGFGSIDDLRGDGPTPLDPPTVKQTGYFRSPLPSPKPTRSNEEETRRTKEVEKKRRDDSILMRDGASRQGSRREMQHVFPMPTDDPSFVDVARASVSGTPRHDEKRPSFHARTDSLPLRAPKPMSPVRREVYDSPEVSSKKVKGKEKEKDKESNRSNDLALGGLAGAAIAAGIAYGMSSPETERHTSKSKSKGKGRAEDEPEREIDSRRMFEDDMARRNGRRPETGSDRRDSYGFNQQPIYAVSPMTTSEATGGKVDPFQFQVNDDAWESSNHDKKGKKPMPAHERMAARAAGSLRDDGSCTPRMYQEDIDRDKRREAEYQEQIYSSNPEMIRRGDSDVNRPLERTDSGRTRDIGEPKPFQARTADSNPNTGRSPPRTSASALDEEAERRIREVVQKWGILGKKRTGFADVVLAARKAELEKVEPVYEPPAPEIRMVERAPKWALEDAPMDYSPEPVRPKERAESPPRWRRAEDEPQSPALTRVKGGDAPPVVRRGSSDADYRYASMHDDYFSSRPNQERPRERRHGRSGTRSPSPPRRGRNRTRSRSVVRGRSSSQEIMEARDPKDHDRRPHNTEHEYEEIVKEADQFTAPLLAQDIIAAVAAIHADENRHPHDPNHPDHDEVQEEADRYWRELELARKFAKQHNNDPTPRIVTPPAMDHHSRDRDEEEKRREKGPYAEPDADFRFDHEMHPHELPLFTPLALRKSFSLPGDFDDTRPFDPSLLGLKRPLLNIVRATPKPDENAKVPQLKEPRSRSQSRERKFGTSRSITQDDEKPSYGKPVEIEDESSSTSREIADIPAITEPEAEAEAEKSVSWGENDTQVYVPVTPYDEARNPHEGSIPSSPETTRAAPTGGLPHSCAHEHHKEVESHSDSEKRMRDKAKGKSDTPEKRPKPKSLWSRFTPDLAKKLKEREEMAYNLANASTIGFADGDEGREVPRDEVAELALERGRRFQDPEVEEDGHHKHHHHKRAEDPELEKGEAFEYKGVVVEPEAPRIHKKKSRKHRNRTPSPPAVGPKPNSPSAGAKMPGSFDSDAEVASARSRGISPPASDVSTVIYHQPSELSDSAGIATGFNSEVGIRLGGLDNDESFVDVEKPTISSNESFEIVDQQPEETHVITVEPAGEQPESFAVVDSHGAVPSEETQPLIVDAPSGPSGDVSREVLETPLTETEGFVTPLAEVLTPFDQSEVDVIGAPMIANVPLGGAEAINASMDAHRELDTSAPIKTPLLESTSTVTEASSSSKSKKKKKKGKKSSTHLEAEPEIIADTSAVPESAISRELEAAAPVAEDATFPKSFEIDAQKMGDKNIIVDLATPALEESSKEAGKEPSTSKDKDIEGENTSMISPPLDASAEVVASEITEPSLSIEPSATDNLSDAQVRSLDSAETTGSELPSLTSETVQETSRDLDLNGKAVEEHKKKNFLLNSDFAAVALAGTAAAVAGIANALIPSTKKEEDKHIAEPPAPTTTKEFVDALAEPWTAPEMPTGMNKKQKKAWEKQVAKEREEFESAQASKELRGEHWSASLEETKDALIGAAEESVKEVIDTSAPVVDESSKETEDSTKRVVEAPAIAPEIVGLTPKAIMTKGEAAEYYNPPADAPDPSPEPINETRKDTTNASAVKEAIQTPAEFIAPEMPAGLNKKAKKAWTQKVAKEREEWENAQTVTAQTPVVLEKREQTEEVSGPVAEVVDAPATVVEKVSKDIIDTPAPSSDVEESSKDIVDAPTEVVKVISATIDTPHPSTDDVKEKSRDITDAAVSVEPIVETPCQPSVEEVARPIVEVWEEPEMPTGLNKKQKTAWKKKIAKEKEEFESAQASKAASAEANGAQTPATIVEEACKDTTEVVDASAPVVEESNKDVVDASAPATAVESYASFTKESEEIVDAPIEVIDAALVIADEQAPSTGIVKESSTDAVAAPIESVVDVVDTTAPSTDVVEESSKEMPSVLSSPPTDTIPAPVIEAYEEPVMPTGLNKKQKQAWKKKIAKEKEEWESARGSGEGSAKEGGAQTLAVQDTPIVAVEESKEIEDAPAPVVEESTKDVVDEPAAAVIETVDQPIAEEPTTIVVDAPPAAPEAGIDNLDDAVRAIHDANAQPVTKIIPEPTTEEPIQEIVEPVREPVEVPEIIETPVDSSAENSAEPPKKMNKRERKAWDKAQREAAAAKALADEEAAVVTAVAADTPFPIEEAPVLSLETLQLEVPEVLPTPVFEDESGAFATAPPETPLATPLETPTQAEQASDSPAKGDADVVPLSMEDTAAFAASDAVPVEELKDLVNVPSVGDVVEDVPTPLETPAWETPAEEAEVSLGGKKKKKKKGKGKAADVAEISLDTPVVTTLETSVTEVVAPAVEQPAAEPAEHDPVADTLALLSGISHTRALPLTSVQQSSEPVSVEQTLESPTDDDDAFHSAAEDRARSATPTGTVDDDDFHSTNGDGAWHSPRMNGHDQPEVVSETVNEPEVTETEVTEDDAFAAVKGKKKKKKKGKGVGSSGVSLEDSVTEGEAAAQESFLANAGTLGAGVGSAAAGPRGMNSGILESEERNADAAGRWESQPISEVMRMVREGKEGEEEREGTVVGHDESGDVLAGQTLTWGSKKAVVSDPVEEMRRVLEGIEYSNTGRERRVVSDPLLNDPDITRREVMPSIDPQFGDLLPLPPKDSPPNEEVDAGALVTDLPPTPADVSAGFQPLGGIQEQAEPSEVKEEILTIDPEIHPRSIRPAIDPQFGDLLELPPSQPGSPILPVDDDAVSMLLPESPPESPAVARKSLDGVRERERESPQTPRKKDTTFAGRSPSVNAVPLKFLLGGRSSSNSNPSSPVAGSATSPTRPKSRHSWDSSKGLQPLTLLSGMERRHSRGSSLAEFESRSLAPLLEAAAQEMNNMSTAVEETAAKPDTDGDTADTFATAVSEKQKGEHFPESALAPVEAPSADTVIPAPSNEVVEQSTRDIADAPIQEAPRAYVEPEMPTGLNKKQKTAWKKKVAKDREEWESARSSAEQIESQAAVQDSTVEVVEPANQVVVAPAPVDESNKETVDAPIEAVEAVPKIFTDSTPPKDIVEGSSRDITVPPTNPVADIPEAPNQPAIEEAVFSSVAEVYKEPEMPTGLNKKQKQAWKKKVAKGKEDWESARSAQSSAEQSSGARTDSGDQKQVEDAAAPPEDLPAVEGSRDIPKEVELEVPVEPMAQPVLDVIAPPTFRHESEPQNVDLETVLQEAAAVEELSEAPALEPTTIETPIEPVPEQSIHDAATVSPAIDEGVAQSTPEAWIEPEMPAGLNKKQKTAWKKKVAKEKEEWESAQSSAAQSGDQTSDVVVVPSKLVNASAAVVDETSKEIVDVPVESTQPVIETPMKVVEVIPETTDASATEAVVDESNKDIVDAPSQSTPDIVQTSVIDEAAELQPAVWEEPKMPAGLNKKQKTTWKKKIDKERVEWESAQASSAQSGGQTAVIVKENKDVIEPQVEVGSVPAALAEETSKEIVEVPTETSASIAEAALESTEAIPHPSEAPAPSTDVVTESSKDIVDASIEAATESTPQETSKIVQAEPEVYQEPEMPSGLNKKQKIAWKKKIAKEREGFESAQASATASGAQTPASEEASKDVTDAPIEMASEFVQPQAVQETPKLEIGGFIETPVAEIAKPILTEQEPIVAPMEDTIKTIVDTPVELVSEPTSSSPVVDESQPAKKLNTKQKAVLAKKSKEEVQSGSASTSDGWTVFRAQTPAEELSAQLIIEETPAQMVNEPVGPIEAAPTPEQPSSDSISDFDAAVRALHDKSNEPVEPSIDKAEVIRYFETPVEPETTLPTIISLPVTPLEPNEPAFESTSSNAPIPDSGKDDKIEIKDAKEAIEDIIDVPARGPTTVFVAPEMPTGLNKKQKKAWERKVQKEREEWESAQASKENNAQGSESTSSATGFSTDAPVVEPAIKTEPIDTTTYDFSDRTEGPSIKVPEDVDIPASEPQAPAIALPAHEGGGEVASYFEAGTICTPPKTASPALKSLLTEAQIADEEQVSESAGEKGDVDSSTFETASSKKSKKKKKGKEVAIEPALGKVQRPVREKEKGNWTDDLDDDTVPAEIAAPTMLPAIVKDAFSRPQTPELKALDAPSEKKSKKKKGKKGAVVEETLNLAVPEPSLESIAIPTEPIPEAPFEGDAKQALPDVSAALETTKGIGEPASAIQPPLESDANDSPPTADAVRETLALLGGISRTREPVIKDSAQLDITKEVADDTIAVEQEKATIEDAPIEGNAPVPAVEYLSESAPAIIELPVMPKGLNKKQKKAWEKKNAALIAEADDSQARFAAASGSQTPAIQETPVEVAEENSKNFDDTPAPETVEEATPIVPTEEDTTIPDVPDSLNEPIAEPSPTEEAAPILEDAPLPEVPGVTFEAPVEPDVAKEIPLPETPLETPFESAFESASSKKKKKKGKKAAMVETETRPETVLSTLPVDAANVLESEPPSNTIKGVDVVGIIEELQAPIEDAVLDAHNETPLPVVPEESAVIVDSLEPSIARNVPLPESSGDATPAEVRTEAEMTSAWEEPEMPKGLNKKKKAEWKKKMAKEKEEWESAQSSAIKTPAEVIEDTGAKEIVEVPSDDAIGEPTTIAEIGEEIAQSPPITLDDTLADVPTASIPDAPAEIINDFEPSIATNIILPDSEMETPVDSPFESAFESAFSKKPKKKKGKKSGILSENERASPAPEMIWEAPKEIDISEPFVNEPAEVPKEAIIELTPETLDVAEAVPESIPATGKATEYNVEASKDIDEPSVDPPIEIISTPLEDNTQPPVEVWEEPIMPTGLNKKNRDAWKKKVRKAKEEWESAQAIKAASAAESGVITPAIQEASVEVVQEGKNDIEMAEAIPIPETPIEESTPQIAEDATAETSREVTMDDVVASESAIDTEIAKDISLPETPLEMAESGAFESVPSSKSKKKKKGKKGAIILEEESASPALEEFEETPKDTIEVINALIDKTVDIPSEEHVTISKPVPHDTVIELGHPSTPPIDEHVDVTVSAHEVPAEPSEPIPEQAIQQKSSDTSGAVTPLLSVSINEPNNSSSDGTPNPEKTEEPMENTEPPKTAFLEHSASGNGSNLPREMQKEMEQQVLVSGAGAGGVGSYGDELSKDVSEAVDKTLEREKPKDQNKKQKKAWEKEEKKRIAEALVAADTKALEDAAKVEIEEISKGIVNAPVAEYSETLVVEEVEDEWKPTRKLSKKEQKAVDKKRREEEEHAEIEAAAKQEQEQLAAIEEQVEAPSAPIEFEEARRQIVTEPEQAVENIETPLETPAEDEWSAPTRKLSKKEQKAADKKRRQEDQAELDAALKREQELADIPKQVEAPATPFQAEKTTQEINDEHSFRGAWDTIDTSLEDEWIPTGKLSKKEKKALDKKRRDADEQALIDAATAATATAAANAVVALVTGDEHASSSNVVEQSTKGKEVEVATSLEEPSRPDSGNESPPVNTRAKGGDKGKGKDIDIMDAPLSAGPTTPIESQDRSISMENERSQVMNVRTASPDRGIFQQALEKVVKKQVQQRDLQEKVQENITAQAVKGSWSFSSLEDDKEENIPWSASRLPPVLEEDSVLEQPRTPDDATRSRSPIYRGIYKEDSAYVGGESPKPRPRSWFDPEYVRDSGVLLREKKSSDSQKSFSERANTDEAMVRRPWPPVDDEKEKETVDLRHKKRSSLSESQSSPYEKITPKDIAKAATGLGIAGGHKRSLSKSPALSESPSREFLLRRANPSQTPSSDEKHSSSSSRQPSALREAGRSDTPRSASDRQHQRQSSLLESLHNDSPRSFSDNIHNPRTRTPSGISREEYYNHGLSATPTSERGASGLGSVLSRPGSVISNRSVTPSLRRVSGRASSDLRALSQQSQSELAHENKEHGAKSQPDSGSASDNNKPSHQGSITKDAQRSTTDVSDSKPPAPNEGKKRVKGMTEVYNGFGEGRIGSPRSPTRPHSMRRKQSMQLLDMQAQMASMAEELAAARQENAVILQAKETAERNLDEARREVGKAQQYKAQAEEVRGLLESMTLRNTDLTRQTLDLQAQLEERDGGAQATIAAAVAAAIADKERELVQLRQRAERLSHDWSGDEREIEELEAIITNQKLEIASLKQSRATSSNGQDYLQKYSRDDVYFEQSCQKLFRGVWRWIHAFSDRRKHSVSDIEDIKNLEDPRIYAWLKDAFTGNPASYLADLDKRRLILMALTMSLFHHYIFNKHFFGLTKDQEEASKVLEMVVDDSDISDSEFRLWRATQFCLFSKSRNYSTQRNDEVLGVTESVMRKLSDVLPQPSSSASDDQRTRILIEELKIIVKKAAELSNDMRRQSTKYSWRQSERTVWGEKRTRTPEPFEAGKMTHAEICVQFMELHRVDEKLNDPSVGHEAHAGLERERQQHIESLVRDFHVVSESEVVPGWRLSWEEMVRRMEEKNRRIEEKGMGVRLSLFPMVVKEGEEGKTVIWKSVVKPVDLKSGIPTGKRRAGGESSVGGSEHGSKHPRVR